MNTQNVTEVKESELLVNFQVEELEKRYEMGWIKGGSASASVDSDGKGSVTVTATF